MEGVGAAVLDGLQSASKSPGSNPSSDPNSSFLQMHTLGEQQVMAPMLGSLAPRWKIQMEFWAAGLGPAQPMMGQAFAE